MLQEIIGTVLTFKYELLLVLAILFSISMWLFHRWGVALLGIVGLLIVGVSLYLSVSILPLILYILAASMLWKDWYDLEHNREIYYVKFAGLGITTLCVICIPLFPLLLLDIAETISTLSASEITKILLPSTYIFAYILLVIRKFEGWILAAIASAASVYAATSLVTATLASILCILALIFARIWYTEARIDAQLTDLQRNKAKSQWKT